jgi:metal-responsive CopG/Arc/MetJ family transcriptional regulator
MKVPPVGSLKRTYALPEEVLRPFEETVGRGQRSALLATLVRNWTDEQRRLKLRKEVIQGCQEMASEYVDQERAYHLLEEEANRGL